MLKDVKYENCGVLNVSWESPTVDSGGGPVTAYRAQVLMGNEARDNCTTSWVSRSCLFRGLVNEANYRVRVQAINRKGEGDWFIGSFGTEYAGIFAVFFLRRSFK